MITPLLLLLLDSSNNKDKNKDKHEKSSRSVGRKKIGLTRTRLLLLLPLLRGLPRRHSDSTIFFDRRSWLCFESVSFLSP